jgi:vacuolar-type H+-ATPase subunit D/Vma8
MVTKIVYAYAEVERAYKILTELVERENKLHEMDMTIMSQHLNDIQYEILPMLEEIVYFDPTP